MRRVRYRFIGRSGNRYIWQSVQRIPGDSRVEEITCNVDWFWSHR
jgi:hypothetical protein